MEHKHSIVIHREADQTQIWVLDYDNGRQIGETREIPTNHAAYPALLAAITAVTDGSGIPVEGQVDAVPLDTGALAKRIADLCLEVFACNEHFEASFPSLDDVAHTTVAIKLEIERALAGIAPPVSDDEVHVSNETPESAARSTESVMEDESLSASE